jgi:hypothetical protein
VFDELARRLKQRFPQIAVVIGARAAPRVLVMAHVKGFYIKAMLAANSRSDIPEVLTD